MQHWYWIVPGGDKFRHTHVKKPYNQVHHALNSGKTEIKKQRYTCVIIWAKSMGLHVQRKFDDIRMSHKGCQIGIVLSREVTNIDILMYP